MINEPITGENKSTFAPYMRHYGKTKEEQLEKNKPLMEWLKQKMKEVENLTEEEAQAREQQWELIKQIIDSARPEGHKLFSEE